MLKNLSKLELTIEGKVYSFLLDMDSPIQHIKEALFQFQGYVAKVEENIKAQMEAKAAAQSVAPELQPATNPEPDIKPAV